MGVENLRDHDMPCLSRNYVGSIESHSSLRGPDCPALSAPTVHAWQHEGQLGLSGASLWNLGGLREAVGLQEVQGGRAGLLLANWHLPLRFL